MDRIDQLFDLLDRWSNLPVYQLERRADILFTLYLPAFLTDHLKIEIRPEMIPEFPVRMGSIYPEIAAKIQNLSCKIDYVALAKDGTKVLFVELKTDALARRQRQDDYIVQAQRLGMPALVDGVCKLFLKSPSKSKYYHLLTLLESLDLLRLPPAFHKRPATGWRGVSSEIAASHISHHAPEISILYLQPLQTEPGEIGFQTFADWITRFDDPLSQKFCKSLLRWACSPAGVLD